MRPNTAKTTFFACILALLSASALRAGSPAETAAQNYKAALADNLAAGAAFLAQPFAKGLAFAVGSQNFSPVGAKPLLGFNLGVGGGVTSTLIDKDGIKSAALNNGTDLSGLAAGLPAALPLPLGTANLHFGLPKVLFFESLDLGLKLNFFNAALGDVSVDLSGMGVELRGNVFEAGLVSPLTLTLGLGVEQLKTAVRFSQATGAVSGSFGGTAYTGDTRNVANLDSQILLTTLKASVSRKFLFFTPYAGAAVNLLNGEASFRSAQEGSLTFDPSGTPYVLTDTIEAKATKPVPGMDIRVGAGFELSFFVFYLAVGGEYGLLSNGVGGNAQLGFQFR